MNQESLGTACVLGGGAFGSAVAQVLSVNFKKVLLMVRSQEHAQEISQQHNPRYLPGKKLSSRIHPVQSWEEVEKVKEGRLNLIVYALPMSAMTTYCAKHAAAITPYLKGGALFLSLAKGIDVQTKKLSDDILLDYFPAVKKQFTYLSGPSFAAEIVAEHVTLVSISGENKESITQLVPMLSTPYFKPFPSTDKKGVLLGGALKNVLAIAGGLVEGLGFHHNTRAALITRGIIDMLRIGEIFNAHPETFYGLSGMGDLILSITGDLSRNKNLGLAVARGVSPEAFIAENNLTVEGYKTARAVHDLAQEHGVRTRIFQGVYDVLYHHRGPLEVIEELMGLKVGFNYL